MRTTTGRYNARRWVTLIAIAALHVALMVALVHSSQFLRVSVPTAAEMEIHFWPPAESASTRASVIPVKRNAPIAARLAVPSPNAITMAAPEARRGTDAAPTVDWDREAHEVAAASPPIEYRAFGGHGAPDAAGTGGASIFDARPAHPSGEQIHGDDGRWLVSINDDCYVVSDPFLAPDASHNGMAIQTYCRGKSKEARGDLFDRLPLAGTKHQPSANPGAGGAP